MNKWEIEDMEKLAKSDELGKLIWNAAIEKAVLEAESKSHITMPLIARIRLLKIGKSND